MIQSTVLQRYSRLGDPKGQTDKSTIFIYGLPHKNKYTHTHTDSKHTQHSLTTKHTHTHTHTHTHAVRNAHMHMKHYDNAKQMHIIGE